MGGDRKNISAHLQLVAPHLDAVVFHTQPQRNSGAAAGTIGWIPGPVEAPLAPWLLWLTSVVLNNYPLVICYIAIENGHL